MGMGEGVEYLGIGFLVLIAFVPVIAYFNLARMVDSNAQYTDLKTLEFGPTRLVVTGPDWKSELPWTYFKRFSEDETYFYLHLTRNGIGSAIPKEAFSREQQERFRRYAQTVTG
jgi:hypothetical protein